MAETFSYSSNWKHNSLARRISRVLVVVPLRGGVWAMAQELTCWRSVCGKSGFLGATKSHRKCVRNSESLALDNKCNK